MYFEKRQSGIPLIGELPWGSHFCQFYRTKEDLFDILLPFFKAGLENNEFCVWAVSEALDIEDALRALKEAVPSFENYVAKGQMEFVPSSRWHALEEKTGSALIAILDKAIASGFDGLRFAWNAFPEKTGANIFICPATDAISRFNIVAVFAYPRDEFDAAGLMEVIKNHQFALVRNAGTWEIIESSEARIARDELNRSEEKLKSLFSNMSEGFAYHRIVLDAAGKPCDYIFLEVNESFEKLTGLKGKDTLGKKVTEALPGIEKDPTDWIGKYGAVALTGKPVQFESYAEPLKRWYSVSAFSPHRGYFGVTFSDITRRKQAEEDLRKANDELELRVQERTKELARLNETLDQRVAERTSELQAANETLRASRLASLNLVEDAVAARKQAEKTSVELRREVEERKRAEEALKESEERVRRKLDSILSPEGDIGDLELSDIIDLPALQSLVDNLYKFLQLPIGILDLKGKVLVGVGWQDICTKFHRAYPDTCRYCTESDLELTKGVSPGKFKLYKCKNGMWDAVTPLMVGGEHMGNIFWGQFFFEDETLDLEFFRTQARKYGFDEHEYLAVLEKVPRIKREALDRGMAFYLKLADILSKLSYSNIKLAQTLSMRDTLLDSLRESEERLKRAQEISHLGSWELDLGSNTLTWSDEVYRIFGLQPQKFSATYEAFLEYVHSDDRAAVNAAYSGSIREGKDTYEIEHRVVRKSSGEVRYVHEKCQHFRDETGRIIRSVGMVHDITDRKRAEEQVQRHVEKLRAVNEELMRFNKAAVGRELSMIRLKKEVNELRLRVGEPPRYRLDFEKEETKS